MERKDLEDVLKRIKEGDKGALEILYREMKGCVYGLAFVYTGSHSDSEDIMQNTFLNIWNRAKKYKAGNPSAWIMTIARNLSVDYIRSRGKMSELDENIPDNDHISDLLDSHEIKRLLSYLGKDEREVVLLYSYGFSHSEISEIIHVPHSTVRSRYSNAIKKIIKISGGENSE